MGSSSRFDDCVRPGNTRLVRVLDPTQPLNRPPRHGGSVQGQLSSCWGYSLRMGGSDLCRIRCHIQSAVRLRSLQISFHQREIQPSARRRCHHPLVFVTAIPRSHGKGFCDWGSHLGSPQHVVAHIPLDRGHSEAISARPPSCSQGVARVPPPTATLPPTIPILQQQPQHAAVQCR